MRSSIYRLATGTALTLALTGCPGKKQESGSKPAAAQGEVTDTGGLLPTPAERASRTRQFRTVAPVQREYGAIVGSPLASLQSEQPVAAPVAPVASSPMPSNVVAPASPAEYPERPPNVSLAVPKAPERPTKTFRRLAALPPAAAPDHPAVRIIRGSHQPGAKARAPVSPKQKIAALPSGAAAAATDAPPILVLRGAGKARYALAGTAQPAAEPLLAVIRGARPRPVILHHYVQPNALILHIRR